MIDLDPPEIPGDLQQRSEIKKEEKERERHSKEQAGKSGQQLNS
jgi:hypothetical protein